MNRGIVYLIPTVIADDTEQDVITNQVRDVILSLDYFLVEDIRTARRYISKLNLGIAIDDLHFELVDKHTSPDQVNRLLDAVSDGTNVGVMSESGCPGIADPGALVAAHAHERGLQVIPLSGPSSILMALMASGFNGQSFVFHGYIPIDKKDRQDKIKSMERDAIRLQQTQIFMDTPYRNQKLFEDLIAVCSGSTKLCVAREISGSDELIKTKPIAEWKKTKINLHKIPTIFCMLGG